MDPTLMITSSCADLDSCLQASGESQLVEKLLARQALVEGECSHFS